MTSGDTVHKLAIRKFNIGIVFQKQDTVLCQLVVILSIILLIPQILSSSEKENDLTRPFLLLSARRASTLEKELNEAIAAGYRVLFATTSYGAGLLSVDEDGLLLKKADPAEDKPDYLLLKPRGASVGSQLKNLRKEMNGAVAKGYRAVPRTLFRRSTSLLMERQPDSQSTPPTEYLILSVRSSDALQKEICKAASDGFRFVDMLTLDVFMEKSEPKADETGVPTLASSESGEDCRYLVMGTRSDTTMREELNEGSARGYRVLAGGLSGGGPIWAEIIMLMEKISAGPADYEYEVLEVTRIGKLREEIQEAAAKGFRALPRTFAGNKATNVLVLEKGPGAGSLYEYVLVVGSTSSLNDKISELASQGYYPIGLNSRGVALLERASVVAQTSSSMIRPRTP